MTLELSTSIGIDLKTFELMYVTLFSRSMFYMIFFYFFNTYLSTMIDLESLG